MGNLPSKPAIRSQISTCYFFLFELFTLKIFKRLETFPTILSFQILTQRLQRTFEKRNVKLCFVKKKTLE